MTGTNYQVQQLAPAGGRVVPRPDVPFLASLPQELVWVLFLLQDTGRS
jgi:hypothetical protein